MRAYWRSVTLLLGAARLTGRFVQDFELVPHSLVAHICEQLGLQTPLIRTYPQRQPTRYEHVERIRAYLGLRSFKQTDNDVVISHVRKRVRAGARLHELLADVEEMLREQKIVLPGVTMLERLIGRARVEAEDELFREISERVDKRIKTKVLALLKVREGEKITPFQQLQQAAGRPSPDAFNREVDALGQVRVILPDDLDLNDLDGQLLERLAQMVSGLPIPANKKSRGQRVALNERQLIGQRGAGVEVEKTADPDQRRHQICAHPLII